MDDVPGWGAITGGTIPVRIWTDYMRGRDRGHGASWSSRSRPTSTRTPRRKQTQRPRTTDNDTSTNRPRPTTRAPEPTRTRTVEPTPTTAPPTPTRRTAVDRTHADADHRTQTRTQARQADGHPCRPLAGADALDRHRTPRTDPCRVRRGRPDPRPLRPGRAARRAAGARRRCGSRGPASTRAGEGRSRSGGSATPTSPSLCRPAGADRGLGAWLVGGGAARPPAAHRGGGLPRRRARHPATGRARRRSAGCSGVWAVLAVAALVAHGVVGALDARATRGADPLQVVLAPVAALTLLLSPGPARCRAGDRRAVGVEPPPPGAGRVPCSAPG